MSKLAIAVVVAVVVALAGCAAQGPIVKTQTSLEKWDPKGPWPRPTGGPGD